MSHDVADTRRYTAQVELGAGGNHYKLRGIQRDAFNAGRRLHLSAYCGHITVASG